VTNYIDTSTESGITFILLGSEGFLGSAFTEESLKLSTRELLKVDPKVDYEVLERHILKFRNLEELMSNYRDIPSLNSKVKTSSRLILVNSSGISRSGKYINDSTELAKYNVNINIVNTLAKFLEFLTNNNFYKKILVVHFSTLAIEYSDIWGAYELSKSAQESMLVNLINAMKSKTMRLIIIRLSDVYGDENYHQDKIINKLLHAAKNKTPLTYVDSKAIIRPVHISFVVNSTFHYITKFLSNPDVPLIQRIRMESKYVFKVKTAHRFALSKSRNKFLLCLLIYFSKILAALRFYIIKLKVTVCSKQMFDRKYFTGSLGFSQHYYRSDFYKYISKEGQNS